MIAAFFGAGLLVDAYTAALRIPNILRNLLGEGTLSASFVPVYSAQLERTGSARGLARGVLGLVLVVSGLIVGIGVAIAPWLAAALAPGFDADLTRLTARLIRILFPMAGLMIVGAWCLGVLTSHRRFFLPFAAPVLWNLAQVAGLLIGARLGWEPLIVVLAWSTLIGGALQVAVQLPAVGRLVGSLLPAAPRGRPAVDAVARNAAPVAAGQGIFQVSSLLDVTLASWLVAAGWAGALAGLYFAQRLVQLPMALFGVSVAVAALPEMSRQGDLDALRPYLESGARRILYFVIPAVAVFVLYGDLLVDVVYRRGDFGAGDARLVHWILAAYAAGLIAASLVKLFAGAFHARQDTKTPMKYAAVAVTVGIAVGAALMFGMEARGFETRSAAGLALGGATGSWLNLALLSRGLGRRGLGGVWRRLRPSILRYLLATGAAVALSWPVRVWLSGAVGREGLPERALLLGAALVAGGLPYVLIAGLPAAGIRLRSFGARRHGAASGPESGVRERGTPRNGGSRSGGPGGREPERGGREGGGAPSGGPEIGTPEAEDRARDDS